MLVTGPYIKYQCRRCRRLIERNCGRNPFKEMDELRDDNTLTCAECACDDLRQSIAEFKAAAESVPPETEKA